MVTAVHKIYFKIYKL